MKLVEVRNVDIDAARVHCRDDPEALAIVELFASGDFEGASRAAGVWDGPIWSALPDDMLAVFDEMGLGAKYTKLEDVRGGDDDF